MKIRAQVRADLPERDRAAAPEDRPERHGHRAGPRLADGGHARRAGWTVPIDQTLPNVNLDEILSSLDADTRTYLQLLVGAAGEGLDGQGKALSAGLKRFEPTAPRPGQAQRRAGRAPAQHPPRRSTTSSLLSQALGDKDDDLAALVDSSNRVFKRLRQPGREPARGRCRSCPAPWTRRTPRWPRSTSSASVLGPTLGALRPAPARSGRRSSQTRPFLTETTPIIQNQLRPFARAALPVVKVAAARRARPRRRRRRS